jgi:lysophospholipase
VGTILITHGQAEHSDCYNRLVDGFQRSPAGKNWNFIGWDMRGHGKSDGLRGYAKDFDEYVLDYHLFLEESLRIDTVKNKPVILLAHSMGGLVQNCALREKKYDQFNAQVLSAPLFGVSIPVPAWKESGSELLNMLTPKFTLGNEITNEQLTRDPEVIKEYEKDTYRHNKISAGVFLGFKREFAKLVTTAASIHLPTLLHISDNDPVVSSAQAQVFFDNLASTDKEIKYFEG